MNRKAHPGSAGQRDAFGSATPSTSGWDGHLRARNDGEFWKTAPVTSSLWCFQCGAEYDAAVDVCIECGVGLVPEAPIAPESVGTEDEEQLAYEFHDWSFESRRMLDQLLTARAVAHAWQGATMIVRAADESTIDELVEEVEHAALPTLDPELEHVVYEMAGWTAEQQTVLSTRLGAQGVPHEFDQNGDLVLHAEDEAAIEALLDEIERGALSLDSGAADDDDDDRSDLADVDANEVLSTMFDACDRLRKNARDANGVLKFLDTAPTVRRMGVPFGFERPAWTSIVDQTVALETMLDTDDSDDADIERSAQQLRDVLFGLI